VDSVTTSGVLLTRMPRAFAAARSTWSVPALKEAMIFTRGPRAWITPASNRSETVGTTASASWLRATSSAALSGRSSGLSTVR